MEGRFNSAVLTLECPDCGNQMKRTLGHLRIAPALLCAACDSVLNVDSKDLRAAVAILERNVA